MTEDELETLFETHDEEFIKFDRVENPRHPRADLCAFLLLHDLSPIPADDYQASDMVCHAEHDKIWLDADPKIVAANATESDIITLIRCGVMYDDGFCMYV